MEEVIPLSWLWYVLIFIIVVNAAFFGTLAVFSFIEDRRLKNEQSGNSRHAAGGDDPGRKK